MGSSKQVRTVTAQLHVPWLQWLQWLGSGEEVMERSRERSEFWADILTTAIENYGYASWFVVTEYVPWSDAPKDGFTTDPAQAYAVITIDDEDDEEYGKQYRVDANVLATGYARLTNPESEIAPVHRERIETAYQEFDGGLDVVDALNILQHGIFGELVYA